VIYASGGLTSPQPRCLPNRKVRVLFNYGSGFVPVDVARSSDRGYFAGAGPSQNNGNPAQSIKFHLVKSTYTKHGHKQVCGGDTIAFPFP
jgi:hypothetical protein